MHADHDRTRPRAGGAALLIVCALALAIFMTWPLAGRLGSLGRTGVGPNANPHFGSNADGMFSLWNVSWVARTVVADPLNLFDANIFHPYSNTLAYSEANIVAGVLGIPAWWITKNPYATLNVVILIAFSTAWLGAYLLLHYLTGDRWAAAIGAIFFAFCPYVFAHTAHIQLMLTAGIPLTLLALHRLADAPSIGRGALLGAALLIQALACAYYGIFAGLMVGYAVLFLTVSRGLLRNRLWWFGLAAAAVTANVGVAPFFYPYLIIQEEPGFTRTLDMARPYSANLSGFLASSAYAHLWLLRVAESLGKWNEVMFPGILPVVLGAAGVLLAGVGGRRAAATRERETVALYATLGVLAVWASLGPAAGFYSVLYKTMPAFSLLRAPSRLAIVIVLCLAVPAALAVRRLLHHVPARLRLAGAALAAVAAIGDMATEMPWERAIVPPPAYEVLAAQPRGPLVELPFYAGPAASHLHTQYMLFSTQHWMPMLNGYSDHTPPGFRRNAALLEQFPSLESFGVLRDARVRYIGVHWDMYGHRAEEIRQRIQPYRHHLSPVISSQRLTVYEIVSFP